MGSALEACADNIGVFGAVEAGRQGGQKGPFIVNIWAGTAEFELTTWLSAVTDELVTGARVESLRPKR